jgi:hypothetical protein
MPRRRLADLLRARTPAAFFGGRERLPSGLIQTGDVAQKLQERYGLHGKVQVTSIADQLYPVTIVDDVRSSGEGWWQTPQPGGERRYWVYAIVAPVAGQLSLLAIQNPAGSGLLVKVESFAAVFSGTDIIRVGRIATFPGAPPGTFGFRDNRVTGPATFIDARQSTNVGNQVVFPYLEAGGGTGSLPVPVDLVLLPGETFGVEKQTANAQLNAGIYLTIRAATP